MPCLCHSGKEYQECCKAYHEGEPAPSALLLMRSRYSGYAMRKSDYIIETTAPKKRETNKGQWKKQIEAFSDNTTFYGLEILNFTEDTVTFKALLRQGEHDCSFTEKSHFINEKGRWYYECALSLT